MNEQLIEQARAHAEDIGRRLEWTDKKRLFVTREALGEWARDFRRLADSLCPASLADEYLASVARVEELALRVRELEAQVEEYRMKGEGLCTTAGSLMMENHDLEKRVDELEAMNSILTGMNECLRGETVDLETAITTAPKDYEVGPPDSPGTNPIVEEEEK